MSNVVVYRPGTGEPPARDTIPDRYRWDLGSICRDWNEWTSLYARLETAIEAFKQFQGTLAQGGTQLLAAFTAMDDMGALSYRVWYFAALQYDEDQRLN